MSSSLPVGADAPNDAPGSSAGLEGDVHPGAAQDRDILVMTDACGKTLWVNDAFVRSTGYSLDEMRGRTPGSVLQGPGTDPAVVRTMSARIAAGTPCPAVEVLNYRKDGSELWLRMDISPIPGADGRPMQFVSVQTDITAMRRRAAADSTQALRLGLAQDSELIGFWERDLVSGTFRIDPHVLRMWGFPGDEPAPLLDTFLDRIPEPDRTLLMSASAAAQRTREPSMVRVRVQQPSGQQRTLQIIWRVAPDAHGTLQAVGMTVDITESALSRDQRARLAEQLELGVALTGMAVWVVDLATERVTLNRNAFALLDLDPVIVPTREAVLARVHPQDQARAAVVRERALREFGPVGASLRLVAADGRLRHIMLRAMAIRDPAGRPVRMVGAAVDITEQVEALEAARKAGDLWSVAAAATGLAVWEHVPDADAWICDDAMYRLFGYEPGSVDAATLRRLGIGAGDQETLRALKVGTPAGEVYSHEFSVTRRDGTTRRIATRGTSVMTSDGRTRYMGVCWDITAEHEARAALGARDQLQRANEAKSEFISSLSHELRTPLNAILGFSQLLEMGGPAASEDGRLRYAGQIRQAGQHMLRLVGDVVELAQLEAGVLPVDIVSVQPAGILREACAMIQPLATGHQVELVLDPRLEEAPHVAADSQRLRQVALNLLSNAIKYNRPGGRAEIGCSVDPARREVIVEVRDSGIGMDHAQLRDLFTPYARLGRELSSVDGLGLGMGLTKAMVERMGGRIGVESTPGAGSTFRVTLPLAAHPPC